MQTVSTLFVMLALTTGQASPEWKVTTVEGSQSTATLPSLDFSTLIAIRRLDKGIPGWPSEPHAILANGDRIVGKLTAADARSLTFENKFLGKVSVPITAVAAIWNTTLPAGTPLDPLTSEWVGDRKSDAILLSNRDIQRGTIERIGEDSAVWLKQPGTPSRKYDADKTVALCFSSGLTRMRTPKIAHAVIVLTDGSRVTIDTLVYKENTFGIGTVTGSNVYLPETALVSLNVLEGKAVYLAELKPKLSKTEPALSLTWPMVLNRSAKGNPLRVDTKQGVQTFERGIGTHAKTTVEYALNGQYRRFEAVVGLDATTGKRGRVNVQILVDGKVQSVDRLADLRAELGPIDVVVDISNAKTLTLVTDFGPAGDVNADVNWCNARLIRN